MELRLAGDHDFNHLKTGMMDTLNKAQHGVGKWIKGRERKVPRNTALNITNKTFH